MSTGSDAPEPPWSADDVLRALAEDAPGAYGKALALADAHRDALIGPLLDVLERGIADPIGASSQDRIWKLVAINRSTGCAVRPDPLARA